MGYPYHDYSRRPRLRQIAVVAGLAIVVAAAFFGVRQLAQRPAFEEITLGTTEPSSTPAPSSTRPPATSTTTVAQTTLTAQAGPTIPSTLAPPVELAPVVAIFDTETITLAGAVPDQAAAERLITLAQANSKTPAATVNLLTIDPAVPADVAVRVVELNSVRFPEGEAIVTFEHAAELQRMVAFMTSLPQVTVTVIGHSDDGDNDIDNLLLSQQRADAVVQFLVDQGIDRLRLSSAGARQTELATLDGDAAALALNRRTEFVVANALAP